MREYIDTPNGLIAIDEGEILYRVEGAGGDRYLIATATNLAAQEAAEWQHGDDGRHSVRVEWCGTGPGSAVAEYDVWVDDTRVKNVVVYEQARSAT